MAALQLKPRSRILHLAIACSTSPPMGFSSPMCAPVVANTRAVGGLVATSPAPHRVAPSPPGAELSNPLLMSGLALAGANRRSAAIGDEDDGILTAEEVTSLDLSATESAVLSACDTGRQNSERAESEIRLAGWGR
jgi:hypothetical protein